MVGYIPPCVHASHTTLGTLPSMPVCSTDISVRHGQRWKAVGLKGGETHGWKEERRL